MNQMKAFLLFHAPLRICATAARTCIGETLADDWKVEDSMELLLRIIKRGHESVLEHVNYSFCIENVTRALLQELARHRHISLSVESTRWAMHKGRLQFRLPDGLGENKEVMEAAIREMLDSIQAAKLPNDVAKYLLPECVLTKLVMTVNLRELRHIYKLRAAPPALPEFQELMRLIADALPNAHRALLEA